MDYDNYKKVQLTDSISVYNADCMDLLKETPDNYYQLCIVDPPYGIGEASGKEFSRNKSKGRAQTRVKYKVKEWDDSKPSQKYFDHLNRVSKNQVVWGGNHLISNISLDSSCWLVWDKDNSGDFADCELAYTSFSTAVRKFRYRWNGMLQEDMKNKEIRIHPTQKPVKLYEWILKNYANEGDRILDTHLGSGSSAIACHNYGFEFVGCELDEDYFNDMVKRFKQVTAQKDAFR